MNQLDIDITSDSSSKNVYQKTKLATKYIPLDQMRSNYRVLNNESDILAEAHQLFAKRMSFESFNLESMIELESVLRNVLTINPKNSRLKYELAFVLIQNKPTRKSLLLAEKLLTESLAQDLFNEEILTVEIRMKAKRLGKLVEKMLAQSAFIDNNQSIRRVNWALFNQCPMICKGCYNTFTSQHLTFKQAKMVIDKLVDQGVKELVVSGGDPILSPYIYEFIDYAHKKNLLLGIDTTGYTLNEEILRYCSDKICYLGLPIDGSTNQIQNAFRHGPKDILHKANQNFKLSESLGIPVKINTTVSRHNLNDLIEIGKIIERYQHIKHWSLFKWWEIRSTNKIRNEMYVSEDEAILKIDELKQYFPLLDIRYRTPYDRELSHFFIQSNGQVVTFGSEVEEEIILGHILKDPIKKILRSPALDKNSPKFQSVSRFKVKSCDG